MYARDLPDLFHDDIQQVVGLSGGRYLRDQEVTGSGGIPDNVIQAGKFGFPPGVLPGVLADIRHQVIFQVLVDGVHLIDIVTGRREHLDKQLRLLSFRQVLRLGNGRKNQQSDASNYGHQGQSPGYRLHQPVDEPEQRFAESLSRGVQAGTGRHFNPVRREKTAAQGRHHQGRDQQRHQYGGGDGNRDIGIQLPGFLLDEDDGEEYEHRGQRGCQQGRPYLGHAIDGGAPALLAGSHVPVNVLQHHDAVIQGHADGKGNPGQGDHIDGAPADQQAEKRGQGADGYADSADKGGGRRPEEQEQDDGSQQGADNQVLAHIHDGIGDVSHVIGVQRHVQAALLEQAAVELFRLFHHVLLDFHHIGTDLPAHSNADIGYSVTVGVVLDFKGGQFRITQVAQADEGAIALGDDHVFNVFRGGETAHGAQQVAAFSAVQVAPGNVPVAGADGVAHLGQGDLPLGQLDRVHVNLDLTLRAAI